MPGEGPGMAPPSQSPRANAVNLDFRLLTFRTVRKKSLLFKPSSLWYLAMADLENQYKLNQEKQEEISKLRLRLEKTSNYRAIL